MNVIDWSTRCFSLYEGCACGQTKGHRGLHRCAMSTCGTAWDDVMEAADEREREAFMRRVRRERKLRALDPIALDIPEVPTDFP